MMGGTIALVDVKEFPGEKRKDKRWQELSFERGIPGVLAEVIIGLYVLSALAPVEKALFELDKTLEK